MIGKKNLYFKVIIKELKGIPLKLKANLHITYHFKWEPDTIHSTPELPGVNINPNFNYSKIHCIEDITEEIA